MTSAAGDGDGEDSAEVSPPRPYVSPASSDNDNKDARRSEKTTPEQPSKRGTIDITRTQSDISEPMPSIPPVHQFVAYSSNIYDSDGSDGSIVFNYPPSPLTPRHDAQQSRNDRERFPSFDSMASTGSFQVIGSVSQSPYNIKNLPSAQQVPQQTPVQLLPYDQRRKLMQKREKQQEEQQPQQNRQRDPRQPQMPLPIQQPPYPMQPNPYLQRQMPGMPYQMDPNQPGMPYPMDQNQPGTPYPIDPILYPMPYMGPPPMGFMPMGPPPPMQMMPQPSSRPPPPNQLNTISIVKARQPDVKRKGLPPSGHARNYSGGGTSNPPYAARSRASSTDSNDAPPRPQRRSSVEIAPPPPPPHPPPPPPPPPLNPYHIRADSSGSLSSIGSNGSREPQGMLTLTDRLGNEIAGYLNEQIPAPEEQQNDGFFGFLQFSPSQQQRSVTVEEFHQRNQEFLQQSEYARSKMQKAMRDSSPHRQHLTTSPRQRSHRPGLYSIDDDDWDDDHDEQPAQKGRKSKRSRGSDRREHSNSQQQQYPRDTDRRSRTAERASRLGEASSDSVMSSSSDDSDDEASSTDYDRANDTGSTEEANERTSLLPPSGISTGEYREVKPSNADNSRGRDRQGRSSDIRTRHGDRREGRGSGYRRDTLSRENTRRGENDPEMYGYEEERYDPQMPDTTRRDNTRRGEERYDPQMFDTMRRDSTRRGESNKDYRRKKGRKSDRRRRRQHDYHPEHDAYNPDLHRSSSYRASTRRQLKTMENERSMLIAQWKAEAIAEAEAARAAYEVNRWDRRLGHHVEATFSPLLAEWMSIWTVVETFISNLPLTIGAIALAIVTLGNVWFKFAEENLDSCEPVHFHSSQCTFPEFPGCFYCDKTNRMYKIAVNFHFTCSTIAGLLALSFFAKVLLATRVVLDEMSSPTTASPAGLICMTTVCVFAGRGFLGQCLVTAAATLHLCLAGWFIYMALAYHIMPEPSWFPNTVGIGMSAVKTWLYYPMPGHLLMAISLSLNLFFFPISLIRVFLNEKMSAPVCWIQMSAPAVSLYALTIMGQPSFVEEHPDITKFQRVHRMVYLPCMHVLFALACIGVISSVQSFVTRWDSFKKKAFSPAHAAFCFPTLAHANAIQAYRAAVNSFSDISARSPFKVALYIYWVTMLVSGTLATIFITTKFFYHLPSWTQVDVFDEEEPPAPYETSLTLSHMVTAGESLQQPFVSPAVLQANETGALVMLPSRGADGRRRYRRTRRLTALGFEPIMNVIEMDHEREVLLDWVGKHPPRRRTQTLSVPGIDFNYGFGDFGFGNSGVYGAVDASRSRSSTAHFPQGRGRSSTMDNPVIRPWMYSPR